MDLIDELVAPNYVNRGMGNVDLAGFKAMLEKNAVLNPSVLDRWATVPHRQNARLGAHIPNGRGYKVDKEAAAYLANPSSSLRLTGVA
jgi:hypothetical protein